MAFETNGFGAKLTAYTLAASRMLGAILVAKDRQLAELKTGVDKVYLYYRIH